jgi:hypothetical protein
MPQIPGTTRRESQLPEATHHESQLSEATRRESQLSIPCLRLDGTGQRSIGPLMSASPPKRVRSQRIFLFINGSSSTRRVLPVDLPQSEASVPRRARCAARTCKDSSGSPWSSRATRSRAGQSATTAQTAGRARSIEKRTPMTSPARPQSSTLRAKPRQDRFLIPGQAPTPRKIL